MITSLKDIRYRHLVKFSFETSNPEVVYIFSVTLHDHNYLSCSKPIAKQSCYCNRFLPQFNTLNDHVEIHGYFLFTNAAVQYIVHEIA